MSFVYRCYRISYIFLFSLMAGHSTSARGFGFFDISVDLSKEGFENVEEIIKIIFQVQHLDLPTFLS